MHIYKLLTTFLKVNIQQDLAYRADAIVNMALSLMWLGWELTSLSIIFSNTETLGGWGPSELIALLGVWRLVNVVMATIVWPNTEKFNNGVRDGSLDYTFLQPANSQLLISITRIVVWRAWDLLLALTLIVAGITSSGGITTPLNVIAFLGLTISGVAIIYSLWIVLISFTFWFTKFDNNVTIMQALMDAGRYPAQVYPVWLRAIVTFIIPIAVATTVPLQALRGDLQWWQILGFLVIGVGAFIISARIWKAGVRRYSGASS
ncbi:MAG: ABC-2 family transporter protein [Chloroflexi bacterium]|nr:ABC-2 family transporter protein [Chloroflexota bacterium]